MADSQVHACTGTYCLPVFLKSQADFRSLGDNVTAAQLDGVCNICNQAYVNLIREFASDFQDAGGSLPDPDVESLSRSKLKLASDGGVNVQDDGTKFFREFALCRFFDVNVSMCSSL